MTKHYWNQDPAAAPAPPTWQQTPRAVPPRLGGGAAAPAPGGAVPGGPAAAVPSAPAAPGRPTGRGTPPPTSPPTPTVAQTVTAPGAQPPAAARAARRGTGTLRHRWLLVAAVLPCLLLAGIGWRLWPQQPTGLPPHIAEGTVQADLIAPDSVSRLAGTTLLAGPQSNRPHAPLAAAPSECATAAGPTTQSVYGQGWKAFLSATYQDAAGSGSYTVNQVIGVFPNGEKASAAFRTLTEGLTKCPTSTLTDRAGRTSKWTYAAHPATEVAVAWTATQGDTANWACYHQARVKGASLIQASVCQAGDGEPTASLIADELTGKVTG
ncbi:sensor domain-containing protein [Kitasatospora sp. NPDC059646]|uniref:sensor domain-containing protein n=1 Tax=Kitasatospora sp. NPDC059646 TaxID=3346893 RepID=UPI0036A3D593